MEVILATGNQGKIKEFAILMQDLSVKVYGLKDFADLKPATEDGKTFCENAIKKAKAASLGSGLWAIADDSGLVVDALDGAPGVYSARFAGEHATDEENNEKLLALLQDVPREKRTARFCCVVAIVSPQGETWTFEGSCEGEILFEPMGEDGFGYDPIFWSQELNQCFGNCSMEEKNKVSHRGKAMAQASEFLRTYLGGIDHEIGGCQ